MTRLYPIVSREEAQRRLQLIFPRGAFDTALSSPLAAAAVSALIYIGAVAAENEDLAAIRWARPSMVLWMSEETLSRSTDEDRHKWYAAAAISERKVAELEATYGQSHHSWYAANSRETLRDETLPAWRKHAAVRDRPGLPTTSSRPRWVLNARFVELFDPSIDEEQLQELVTTWVNQNLTTTARISRAAYRQLGLQGHAIQVSLPTGETRMLESGDASQILKGVVEEWAESRLVQHSVLAISEPGDKVHMADRQRLAEAGITMDVSNLLPDALILDIGVDPAQFWIIEAAASDGEINEERKEALLAWAESSGIPRDQCQFLTAFSSRNSSPAKRRLKDLASGTFAWFLDDPTNELAWYSIMRPAAG